MITLSEISQKGNNKYRMISLICGSKIMTQNELIYKTDAWIESRLVVAKGRGMGREELRVWDEQMQTVIQDG